MHEQPLNLFILKSLPALNFDHKMRLKEYDLNRMVKELEKASPDHINENIKVKMDLADEELKIMADPLRIKEAFLNLIRNANDTMSSGGILTLDSKLASFKLESADIGDDYLSGVSALLSVSDTGMGMDEKTQEKMFEPFFRTKEGVGRGLGFPMAFYIIQRHGGTINVDSTPGIGTTINTYLPLAKNDLLRLSPIPLPSSFAKQNSDKDKDTFQ
jgi:two-component system, cell cycle sensor histidine kinase and response regulator CckA